MTYNLFKQFKEACQDGGVDVSVKFDAKKNAEKHFKLRTEKEIKAFIANGGLEKLKFKDKEIWRNNPKPKIEIFVYAFYFRTGKIKGYIAIHKSVNGKKWIVKSFKPSIETRNRPSIGINSPIRDAFNKAGLIGPGEKNE